MTVELRPLGVLCNLQCQYCYQEPIRQADNIRRHYDIEQMKQAILEDGGPFVLFGGEPLLVPIDDLETLFAWGLEQFGKNGVQSNGALITADHIELFKAYKVGVGISMDGPGELNDLRRNGSLQRTREATARTQANIEALCAAGCTPGIIVTLHSGNTGRFLPQLIEWLADLEELGVNSVRLHLLESESADVRDRLALSDDENIAALRTLYAFERRCKRLRFDIFGEMRELLLGMDEKSSCVWNACDPQTTPAVRGVEGQGQRSNCGRTNKEGIDFERSSSPGFERYLSLFATPQEYGGCAGCRFFVVCKGHCPGTAIDNEMRNRTEHCAVWKALLQLIEGDLVSSGYSPVSLGQSRYYLEQHFVRNWEAGRSTRMSRFIPRQDGGDWQVQLAALTDALKT